MKNNKILLVDDNEQFLSLLNKFLVSNGFEVVCSNNGVEAKELFLKFKPNLVITDIVMPDIDGIELLLAIRELNPDILVIAMSGGNQGHADTYLQMADTLGADIIISKPFQLADLLIDVKKLLVTK